MTQPSLFDAPPVTHRYAGPDITPADAKRLSAHLERVRDCMIDGTWHTLGELARRCGCSESSASARIRDLRNLCGLTVTKRRVTAGLWEYTMEAK